MYRLTCQWLDMAVEIIESDLVTCVRMEKWHQHGRWHYSRCLWSTHCQPRWLCINVHVDLPMVWYGRWHYRVRYWDHVQGWTNDINMDDDIIHDVYGVLPANRGDWMVHHHRPTMGFNYTSKRQRVKNFLRRWPNVILSSLWSCQGHWVLWTKTQQQVSKQTSKVVFGDP